MSRLRFVDSDDPLVTRAWKGHGFTLARDLRGLSMEDVADAIGVSHMDMLAYEQERATPPDGVVAAFARHTDMLPGFFAKVHERIPFGEMFMCPLPEEVERCSVPSCRELVEAVCDFPVGDGKTCDLAMCLDHRVMVEEDVDICAFHRTFTVIGPYHERSVSRTVPVERSRPADAGDQTPSVARSSSTPHEEKP